VADKPDFQKKLYAFAAHIRDPENNPAPPDIEDRRMRIYRDLFFNNLLQLLSSTFPVLKKLHDRDKWRSLVRLFMIHHKAQTPYFLKIPLEFLAFLENEYELTDDDFPFLIELAHYEWIELALSVSEESNDALAVDADGDLLDGVPVRSKLAWSVSYRFPVHRISTTFIPSEPGEEPTFMVIRRNRDDELRFVEQNSVTARLLELIDENENQNGRELLESLGKEINYPDAPEFVNYGASILQDMRDADIIIGTRTSTSDSNNSNGG